MRTNKAVALAAGLGALLIGAACTDNLPTYSEAGGFGSGELPTTLEYAFGANEVVLGTRVIAGSTDADNLPFFLVANNYDGALDAHLLGRISEFPDTIDLLDSVDSTFTYLTGQVVSTVADTLAVSGPLLDFQLWTVVQEWDSTAVSWENAVNVPGAEVPWTTPGGTLGRMLDMTRWERADTTTAADSLIWDVGADVVRQLKNREIAGLAVTVVQPNGRAQLSRLAVRTTIQPSTGADTVITRVVPGGPHNFVFTPRPPTVDTTTLSVGGVTSDRSQVTLDLSQALPACTAGVANCAESIAPGDVSLNRVSLLLEPAPIPAGYRPARSTTVTIRRLLEPELGDRAPLGETIGIDTISAAQAAGTSGEPIRIDITAAVERALLNDQTQLAISLLVEPAASVFSYTRFTRTPQLRFIYTLPQQPELP